VSVRGVLPVSSSSSTVVVAVEVGKRSFAVSVTAADRRRLFGPVEVAMTRPAVSELIGRICAVLPSPLPPAGRVQVAVEAAGHYHQPLLAPSTWPSSWQVRELNPAQVSEQRRVMGRVMGRRRVKTDAVHKRTDRPLHNPGRRCDADRTKGRTRRRRRYGAPR